MFERFLEVIGLIVALGWVSSMPGCIEDGCFSSVEDPWPPARSADDYYAQVSPYYHTSEEKRMLELAEAALPPRDDLAAMAALDPNGIPNAEIPETGAWWYASVLGLRIPYAITGGAVAYYEELVHRWKADPANAPYDSANLYYDAKIEYHKTLEKQGAVFENVYVATMSMSWDCIIYESEPYTSSRLMFFLERTVILDEEGQVLYIFGDGHTTYY